MLVVMRMDEKIWAAILIFFTGMIIGGFVLDGHYTKEVAIENISSPVPVSIVSADEIYHYYGWGGTTGSTVLRVNNSTFWNYAKKFGRVWIVKDARGWHVLTFGNTTFGFELMTIDANKVVQRGNNVIFYNPKTYDWLLWAMMKVIGLLGFIIWNMVGFMKFAEVD